MQAMEIWVPGCGEVGHCHGGAFRNGLVQRTLGLRTNFAEELEQKDAA